MANSYGPGGQLPPNLRGHHSTFEQPAQGLLQSTPVGMPLTHLPSGMQAPYMDGRFSPDTLADAWEAKHSKSAADIAEVIWPDGTLVESKGGVITYTVVQHNAGEAVVKWKDRNKPDQKHPMKAGAVALLAGGFYHVPTPK
jgi:hypothetical protein